MENITNYQQKIYLLGDMIDPMSPPPNLEKDGSESKPSLVTIDLGNNSGNSDHPLVKIFPHLERYDSKSFDAPIIILGEYLKNMDDDTKNCICKIHESSKPIILMNVGENEVNILLGVIGLNQDYEAPDDVSYTECFALDNENGFSFRYIMYPSMETNINSIHIPGSNSGSGAHTKTASLVGWLSESGKRVTDSALAEKKWLVEKLASDAESSSNNLESYVKGYNSCFVFSDSVVTLQLSYWIYALHDFKDQSDWFYIRQEGELNAAGGYHPYKRVDWMGGGYNYEGFYIYSYMMDNFIPGISEDCVKIFRSSPSTETTKTEVTSGVDWDFSGKLGFEALKPAGNVGVNLHLGNTSTVSIQDCQVFNQSMSDGSNAKWLYQFKEVEHTAWFNYFEMYQPSPLQRGMFQPTNQWLWKLSPEVRSSGVTSFATCFQWDYVYSTINGEHHSYWQSKGKHIHTKPEGTRTVTFPFPPVLMTDKNMEFEKAAQTKSLDIFVGREWSAICEEPWCHVELPQEGGTAENTRVHVTVDVNETGTNRTARIKLYTLDSVGSAVTDVFQSKY